MLKSILSAYSDSYIPLKGAITITGGGADASEQREYKVNKQLTFKNCSPFSNCITQINNTQINNAKGLDVVMSMYKLIEYSNSYAKTSGRVWQHYKDDPNDSITDSESFKFKTRITGRNPAASNTKD